MKYTVTEMEVVLSEAQYIDGASEFFASFSSEWDRCRSQVLKYESSQDFCEVDSDSWRALQEGNWTRAVELIPQYRLSERPLYESLRGRNVDIIRVRPIKAPISKYVEWEIQNYFINKEYGERIFICNYIAVKEFVDLYASRDFIIFDGRCAVVHNHTVDGKLIGGWRINDFNHIIGLMASFMFVKSQSHPFDALYKRQVKHV